MSTIHYKSKKNLPRVINYQTFKSEYGPLLAAFNHDTHFLLFLGLPASKQQGLADLAKRFPNALLQPVNFYSNPINSTSPPVLELYGTVFQHQVWAVLLSIPAGDTCSYQFIAQQIKKPTASRAVGNAVGANPISIIVPCHRVLPGSKKVGHYHWGSSIKKQLLAFEGAIFL